MTNAFRKVGWFIFSAILCFFCVSPAGANPNGQHFVIHEVKPGDTLAKIARTYQRSIKQIKTINGLASDRIVPGQSLLLPGNTYTVAAGDSLWKIAERHAISVDDILKANRIADPLNIRPGTKIVIPQLPRPNILTGAYLVPRNQREDQRILRRYRPIVGQLGVFEYHPDRNGKLSPLRATAAITESWKQRMEPVAVITNLSPRGFDPQLAHALLQNPNRRRILIQNIDSLLRTHHYKGVNIDFEQLKPQDRDAFSQFMNELARKLKPSGFTISIAVHPKQGDRQPPYLAAYDYRALGKAVDHFFLMTYDWHWPGGPPGPIAPLDQVRATLQYAVRTVPRQKLFLGIPMYAYDWTLLPGGKTKGRAYSQSQAIRVAMDHGSSILYDERSESPHFFYVDAAGNRHVVWFEDARSLIEKYRLIPEFGIRGMGGWKLGLPFPQAEEMVDRMFHIEKP